MDVRFRITRARVILAVVIASLVTAAGVGFAAATADSGALITACMLKATGTIRLYDANAPANTLVSKPCNATLETPVSWNQKGIQGIQGIQGPAGADGKNGAPGTNGKDGAPGTNGTNGSNGADGKDGAPGTNGKDGAVGPAGAPGAAGAAGAGFTWRGPYEERTVYHAGDAVSFDGSAWITAEGIGSGDISPPDDPWQLLAAKGAPGVFTGNLSSPNGQYSLSLTDSGAQLKGPGGTVTIGNTAIDVVGSGGGSVHVTPFGTSVQGTQLSLNGCTKPVARVGDSLQGSLSDSVTIPALTLTGGFPAGGPRGDVAPWAGLYVPLDPGGPANGHPVPILSDFTQLTVPTVNAQVSVAFPQTTVSLPQGSVTGSITSGAPNVCTG